MSKQAKLEAKLRQAEIARKSKSVVRAGYIPSQLAKVTNVNRLIQCDHYMMTGNVAALSHARDALKKAKKELRKAQGDVHKHVKRRDGMTVAVTEMRVKKPE